MQLSLMRLPGYPFFLSLFKSESNIILAQILIQCAIGLFLVVMFKVILQRELNKTSFLLFILTQVESSLLFIRIEFLLNYYSPLFYYC